MKENETLVVMNKEYKKMINERNIYEEFDKETLVGVALELQRAKHNVESCLKGYMVDMHDIGYWADEVERLRKKIRELL